jgi:hypothetical protein
MNWGRPSSPLQQAALVLMREAFVQSRRGYQESPVPLRHLEWLEEDLRRLFYLGRADPVLEPYFRLARALRKGWLETWVVAEVDAAVAAIDHALGDRGWLEPLGQSG